MSVGQPCGGFLCRASEKDNLHPWCNASHGTVQRSSSHRKAQRGSPECVEVGLIRLGGHLKAVG